MDTADLLTLSALDLPALEDPVFHPVTPPRLATSRNIFDVIREGTCCSTTPTTASRPRWSGSFRRPPKIPTCSPSSSRSTAPGATRASRGCWSQAAERGKQVAVLIELQARFDEENNIIWAQRLEDVGVHVSYGVAGLKTHAKVMLVVRREGDTMRRYVHIGTGNYNPKTARIYTDFGLLSASPPSAPISRTSSTC